MKKAVFLDRDGTINEDVNYPGSPDDLVLLPTVIDALKLLTGAGYLPVIVSNQSGVARGFFTEDDVRMTNACLDGMLRNRGIIAGGYYYCPHHPSGVIELYSIECSCRKPAPGMIFRARDDLGIDLQKSVLIGDKASDIEAALSAGIGRQALVTTGKGRDEARKLGHPRDLKICDSLLEAARYVVKGSSPE